MTIKSASNEVSRHGLHGPAWIRDARKIAVFRALQLGDLLCAVPALRALRNAAPHAAITLVGLPWASAFAERFSRYIDGFIPFPGFPGLPERPFCAEELPSFLQRMQDERFDVALQLHGSGALTNPLVLTFGARHAAGFFMPGTLCPDPARFAAWPDNEHEILRYLDLMEFLGIETHGAMLEFPLREDDFLHLRRVAPGRLLPGSYVCIHPGSQLPSRRWMPERFAAVADGLHGHGLDIVLTGTEGEREITSNVRRAMRAPAIDLTGKTSLGAMAALVAQARLVVCNDTGISHVATAVSTPSVVVASGSAVQRWAPLNRIRHRVLAADVPCRPCTLHTCEIGHPCAERIGVDDVIGQALQLLAAAPHSSFQERRRSARSASS